jgi:hypothetical protein
MRVKKILQSNLLKIMLSSFGSNYFHAITIVSIEMEEVTTGDCKINEF